MSHSVRSHLRLEIEAYDATIRRFIPGYEEGLRRAAREIAAVQPGLVLDLGAGTGALSEAILEHDSVEALEAVDVDSEMLAQARARLERFGARARFRECSFDEPLPSCDAVAASLALHHVPTMDAKGKLFRRIHRALRPGGVFVNADVTISADPAERDRAYRLWANHMTGCGIEGGGGHLLPDGGRACRDARGGIRGGLHLALQPQFPAGRPQGLNPEPDLFMIKLLRSSIAAKEHWACSRRVPDVLSSKPVRALV